MKKKHLTDRQYTHLQDENSLQSDVCEIIAISTSLHKFYLDRVVSAI